MYFLWGFIFFLTHPQLFLRGLGLTLILKDYIKRNIIHGRGGRGGGGGCILDGRAPDALGKLMFVILFVARFLLGKLKHLESLPVYLHLLNCVLRCNFQTLTRVLFFDKITIQFLHRPRSQINTG